jgi:1-acyl-sn-glycerol-3-phosphate acyltransferase
MAALPSDVAFIAKREFRTSIALGLLFTRLGCVFVERFDVQEAAGAVAELDARLRAGESLVAFAEGTFRRDAGLLPFHMGAFSAAAATGASIIPVAVRGTRSMLPDGSRLPNRCPIEVICGASIAPADGGWRSAVDLRRRAREHILHELHEPDLEQRVPGASR